MDNRTPDMVLPFYYLKQDLMIKKINQEQVRPGMYVHKLDCTWLDHPFTRNHFKINGLADIRKLRESGVKGIYIDTEKGADVDAGQTEAVRSDSAREGSVVAATPQTDTAPAVSVAEERGRAEVVKDEAGRVISDIMSDIRLGKQVDAERVSPVVEQMVGSIFRNQDALLGLSRIRQMDRYTFEHSVSVSVLLIAFAKALGLSESVLHEIGIGGILHDIGKMRVPDKILNKPGRLTDQEFSVMREHVNFSRNLLGGAASIPESALQVAMQHHERMDGSGYPGKLTGDEISLYGKMSAIVDIYDAITSDRVYHKGQPPSLVLRRLVEWSGAHVDSALVQHFIQCVGIYPVGSLVALESGRLAIVVAASEQDLLTPTVNVIYDTLKRRFLTPRVLDLANLPEGSQERILYAVPPEKYGIRVEVFLD